MYTHATWVVAVRRLGFGHAVAFGIARRYILELATSLDPV